MYPVQTLIEATGTPGVLTRGLPSLCLVSPYIVVWTTFFSAAECGTRFFPDIPQSKLHPLFSSVQKTDSVFRKIKNKLRIRGVRRSVQFFPQQYIVMWW